MVTLGEGSEDGQVNPHYGAEIESCPFLIHMAEMSSCMAENYSFLFCLVDTRSSDVSTGGDKSVVLVIPPDNRGQLD